MNVDHLRNDWSYSVQVIKFTVELYILVEFMELLLISYEVYLVATVELHSASYSFIDVSICM